METSHQSNIINAESGMLCDQGHCTFHVRSTLKMIYYSYIHSIITYGIIFWGNSPHSTDIFNLLKMKRRLLYLKTQFVPRFKHFSSRL